jgi:hypothetical protein
VADNLGHAGKYASVLRRAGHVGVLIEVGTTYAKASDAYDRGDVKGGNVAVGKGVGSIVGGVAGGAVAGTAIVAIFGVATGGLGLIVVGIAVAAVGYGTGKAGESLGEFTAEKINERVFK